MSTTRSPAKRSAERKLQQLRKDVRELLYEMGGVPLRAVDCDQDKVRELWERVAAQVGTTR